MPAKIIDGAAIAQQMKLDVQKRVAALRAQARHVRLVALLVGGTPAGELYAQRQAESGPGSCIDYDLIAIPADVTRRDVKREIRRLNEDAIVAGIMMHLPL